MGKGQNINKKKRTVFTPDPLMGWPLHNLPPSFTATLPLP